MYVHKIHDYAAHGAQLLFNTSHKNEHIIQSLQLLLQLFYHYKKFTLPVARRARWSPIH